MSSAGQGRGPKSEANERAADAGAEHEAPLQARAAAPRRPAPAGHPAAARAARLTRDPDCTSYG